MSKPKILIITEVFYPEEFLINELALSLNEKNFECTVLTLSPSYPSGKVFKGFKNKFIYKDSYKRINIYRIRAITGYKNNIIKKILRYLNFMLVGSIVSVFIGRRFDYILGYNLGALTDMVPAVIIRKLYKKPLMIWVQDIWPDSIYAYGLKKNRINSFILNNFVKFIYQNATSIGISSRGFESKILKFIKKDIRVHYLPNWSFELEMNTAAIKLSSSNKVHFTFAGNIGKMQNLENVVNAFSLLNAEFQNKAQLNIVGDGSNLDTIKNLAKNNPCIVFHGRQKLSDMPKFFNASDFLIISLLDKKIFSLTVPGKMQTYIAALKPIVAVINGETASLVLNNNIGVHAEPGDIQLISKVFQQCIEMPSEEREKLIINSHKLLESTFNKKLIVDNFVEAIIKK
jgi:glycosyltransferase involved in cell wall biosynthesis